MAAEIPIGLQKIIDYNNDITIDFAVRASFFIAFVAGMIGMLSPCILPFIPAYFSYTFKEKKNITLMTLVFGAGFSLVFVSMGIIAGFAGERAMNVAQPGWIVTIAGLFLIFMGVLSLLGKGFGSFFHKARKFSNDTWGIFLLGVFFALGWSACLGPILASILGIGALMGNPIHSGYLLFAYSLGNLVPLFILSLFWDKFNLGGSRFVKGKTFHFGSWSVHSSNLISGLLFIFLGGVIVLFQGTTLFNTWDIFNTKDFYFAFQAGLLDWQFNNILGIVAFVVLFLVIGYFVRKQWKKRE
ncbi:MAG: cytochrome c biogenesis CcdA family protein [Nanoarchaeota archaeon]|nr:cytochrome c biogenesis CcdA family protein [Nanoarchaeota archaeon]